MSTGKEQQGLLEDLYLGFFNRRQFESFTPAESTPETEAIIQRFLELIKDYPAAKLERTGKVPDPLWQGLNEIGIFGMNVPKAYGGLGLSVSRYLLVLEAMARKDLALAVIPTAHLSIGIMGILLFGNEEQKKRYLPVAASGEMLFAFALTEPKIGSDAQHIETRVELSGDGKYYILNGQKTYITNGNYAGGLTVFAQMDPAKPGFMGAFIVETGWEGVKVGKDMPKMGLAISSTTAITFKDVRVPVENLLGAPGDGFKIAMTTLDYGRLGLGAASAGMLNQSLEDMLRRSSARVQFGAPIKEFELIQEKMVRAGVHSAVAAAMTSYTARLLEDNPTANVALESSHTKLYGTTRAWDTLYDALQVAGGSGYIATQPYEKRMRDFRVATVFEGTTEIHSIYPPLHLFRILGSKLKKKGKSKVKQFVFVLQGLLKRPALSLDCRDATMREAVRLARRHVRSVRKLLYMGLVRHGRDVVKREFFLRRITNLSLNLYGILCMLAKVNADQKQGRDVGAQLRLLAYYLEEAKESLKENSRFASDRKETLHRQVFDDIASS